MLKSLLRRWPFLARLDNTDDGLRLLEDPPSRRCKTTSLGDVNGCLGVGGQGLVDVWPMADFVVCLAGLTFPVAGWFVAVDFSVLAVRALTNFVLAKLCWKGRIAEG